MAHTQTCSALGPLRYKHTPIPSGANHLYPPAFSRPEYHRPNYFLLLALGIANPHITFPVVDEYVCKAFFISEPTQGNLLPHSLYKRMKQY